MTISNDPMRRVTSLRRSWRISHPDRAFCGRSLDQFEGEVAAAYAADDEVAELEKRLRTVKARRKDLRAGANALTAQIIHAVRADPAVGEDSPMYAALGYKRRSERYTGRRRPRVPEVPAVLAAPQAGAKGEEVTG